MLVCNVSLRPARAAITAAIVEVGAATDSTLTIVTFDSLVDDPALALETVDAYLGEIMIEAASAIDLVTVAGGTLTGTVDEAASASDIVTLDAGTYGAAVDEAVAAADVPDATIAGAPVGKNAMLPGVFVNSGTSREANVDGIMVNL